jgi:hypothetical protein
MGEIKHNTAEPQIEATVEKDSFPKLTGKQRKELERQKREMDSFVTKGEVSNYVKLVLGDFEKNLFKKLDDTLISSMNEFMTSYYVTTVALKEIMVQKGVFTEDEFLQACIKVNEELKKSQKGEELEEAQNEGFTEQG